MRSEKWERWGHEQWKWDLLLGEGKERCFWLRHKWVFNLQNQKSEERDKWLAYLFHLSVHGFDGFQRVWCLSGIGMGEAVSVLNKCKFRLKLKKLGTDFNINQTNKKKREKNKNLDTF